MTDLNKLRSEFEIAMKSKHILDLDFVQFHELSNKYLIQNGLSGEDFRTALDASHVVNVAWLMFQEKAKAQAVPEHIITLQRNGEVFKFDLLDLLRRSLKSSKVLKTRENWSHVSKMVGIGSTTATLLCKEMNVDPDGIVFVANESGAEG
ncbi:hypothetical protein [Acinetobacter baumannii]|uniref:hypothetical protein n=1 Tax=Acinetobacter baumannii TaxID=470 RepID=UPI00385D7241